VKKKKGMENWRGKKVRKPVFGPKGKKTKKKTFPEVPSGKERKRFFSPGRRRPHTSEKRRADSLPSNLTGQRTPNGTERLMQQRKDVRERGRIIAK